MIIASAAPNKNLHNQVEPDELFLEGVRQRGAVQQRAALPQDVRQVQGLLQTAGIQHCL